VKKKVQTSFILGLFCLIGVGCSHIEQGRHPSSLSGQSVGVCQIVASENGRQFHVYVDDKPYPNAQPMSAFEAQRMMNRFSQSGTCDF
jgi:hypothetical protein